MGCCPVRSVQGKSGMERETKLVILGATLVLLVPSLCGLALIGVASYVNDIEAQSMEEVEDAPPIVTLAEFEQVEVGMSYRDVVDTIGDSGFEIERSPAQDSTDGNAETIRYAWKNSDASNMSATFENGRLLTKSQLFLE